MKLTQEQKDFLRRAIAILDDLTDDSEVKEFTVTHYRALGSITTRLDMCLGSGEISVRLDDRSSKDKKTDSVPGGCI